VFFAKKNKKLQSKLKKLAFGWSLPRPAVRESKRRGVAQKQHRPALLQENNAAI